VITFTCEARLLIIENGSTHWQTWPLSQLTIGGPFTNSERLIRTWLGFYQDPQLQDAGAGLLQLILGSIPEARPPQPPPPPSSKNPN
jgi:hypothetical protein